MPQTYYVGSSKYEIPDNLVTGFLDDNPDAVKGVKYSLEGQNYLIPENQIQEFLNQNPNAAEAEIDEVPLEDVQRDTVQYEDQELNDIKQRINNRVDSLFDIPKEVKTEPIPDPEFEEKIEPIKNTWQQNVKDWNQAFYTSLDNLILGRTSVADAWQPVSEYFNRFRDEDEEVSSEEIPANIAEGATKLIGLPISLARDITEHPGEFIRFLAVESPKMIGELMQAAGLDPVLQTRVAYGDKNAIAYKKEVTQKVNRYPVEFFLQPFVFRGTVKTAVKLPKAAKKTAEVAKEAVTEKPLVKVNLKKSEVAALKDAFRMGTTQEALTYVKSLTRTKEGVKTLIEVMGKRKKLKIPLTDALNRIIGKELPWEKMAKDPTKYIYDPKTKEVSFATVKPKDEKPQEPALLEGEAKPEAPTKAEKPPVTAEKPVEAKPVPVKPEKPVEAKLEPKTVEDISIPKEEKPVKAEPAVTEPIPKDKPIRQEGEAKRLNERYNKAIQAQEAAQLALLREDLPGGRKESYEGSFERATQIIEDIEGEAKTRKIDLEPKRTETQAITEAVDLFKKIDSNVEYQVRLDEARTLQDAINDPKDPATPESAALAIQEAGEEFLGVEPAEISIAGQNYQEIRDGALVDIIKIQQGSDMGTVIHERSETWYRQQGKMNKEFDKLITEERRKYHERTGEKDDPTQSNMEWFSDRAVDNAVGAKPVGKVGAALQRIFNKFKEYAEALKKSANRFGKFVKEGKVPSKLKSLLEQAIEKPIKTPEQVAKAVMKDVAGRPSPTKVTYSLKKTNKIFLPSKSKNRGVNFITGDPANINLKGEYEDFGIRYPRTYKGWALNSSPAVTKMINDVKKGYNVIAITSLVDVKNSMLDNDAYLNAIYRAAEAKVGKRKAKKLLEDSGDIFKLAEHIKLNLTEIARQVAVPDFAQISRKVVAVATIKDIRTGNKRLYPNPIYKIEVNFDTYKELPQPIDLDKFVEAIPKSDSRVANPFYAAKQYWLTVLNQESPQVQMLSDFAATGDASIFNIKPESYQFASPQIKEIGLEQAMKGIKTRGLIDFHRTIAQMEVESGLTSITTAALGEWITGAEPSIMSTINEPVKSGFMEYLGAAKGLVGSQMTILDFTVEETGMDNLYDIKLNADIRELPDITKALTKRGVEHKTFPVKGNKVNLMIVDQGGALRPFFNEAERIFNAKTRLRRGTARFVGDFKSRRKAETQFLKIIKDYEGGTGHYSKVLRDRLPVHRPRFNRGKLPKRKKLKKPTEEQLLAEQARKPTYELKRLYKDLKSGKKADLSAAELEAEAVRQRTGKKPPIYAGSINLDKLVLSDAMKSFELAMAKLQPKKTVTWDETGEISAEILADYEKAIKMLKKGKKHGILKTAEIDALRQIAVNGIYRLKEMSESGSDAAAIRAVENYYVDIFKLLNDVTSEVGRALNIFKKTVSERRMAKAFSELTRNMNDREIAEFKDLNMENPLEVERFIKRLGDPKLMDYVYEFWYNSILSGIPTHIVNIVSNTLWGTYQVPFRTLSGGIDAMITKFTGKQRQRFVSEIVPMLAGMGTGWKSGAKRAGKVIKTGQTPIELETKWDLDMGGSVGAFERSPIKALRSIAPVMSMVGRALRAADVWSNSMAFDAQINALAKRMVKQEGLKGQEAKDRVIELRKNPTTGMINDAKNYAKYATFMDKPDRVTAWLIAGRSKIWGGRFIVPFVNTLSNLFKRGWEHTPTLGLIRNREYYKGTNEGYQNATSDIIAKQMVGAIIAAIVLAMYNDDRFTGAVPKNKAEREAFYRQGKLPWSIRLGDQWVQYRRIEPFNTVLATATIVAEHMKKFKEEDVKEVSELFFALADGIYDNLLDSSMLKGLSDLMDRNKKRRNIFKRFGATFVPFSSFWRSINRSIEAYMGGDAKAREIKSLSDAFSQVVPYGTLKLKPKMNLWGEEIKLEGGVLRQWLPFKWRTKTKDPVEIEFERIGLYPSTPEEKVTINGKKVEIPEQLYEEYRLVLGKQLHEAMSKSIRPELEPEAAAMIYKRIIDSIKRSHLKMVKAKMMKKEE